MDESLLELNNSLWIALQEVTATLNAVGEQRAPTPLEEQLSAMVDRVINELERSI